MMLHPHAPLQVQGPSPRRGGLTLVFLLCFGLFLALLALAVDGANLWSARQELQVAADAAALAAVASLADDRLLTAEPEIMVPVVEGARKAAAHVGLQNPVAGLPHGFEVNPGNQPEGDLVVGYLDGPPARGFTPTPPSGGADPLQNAVLARAVRSRERGLPITLFLGRIANSQAVDARAEALAHLDRDVVGFRPQGNLPLPLAPLALFSDPTAKHPASWEAQTSTLQNDRFHFDRAARRFRQVGDEAPAGDGLFEMTVRVPLIGADLDEAETEQEPNGALLIFAKPGLWPRQFQHGLMRDDLHGLGGQLTLGWDDTLPCPGALFAPGQNDPDLKRLLDGLEQLAQQAAPRAWSLYRAAQPAGEGEPPTVVVCGFVAARLIQVRLLRNPYPHVELTLQPCQLLTNAAVTERRKSEELLGNRFIAKPRLVR